MWRINCRSIVCGIGVILTVAGCQKAAPTPALPSGAGIGGLRSDAPLSDSTQSVNKNPPPSPLAPPDQSAGSAIPSPLTAVSPRYDLLQEIDVSRDSKNGIWKMEDGKLISPGTSAAALQILYQPPPAYRWTVVAQRLSGSESLILGFLMEQQSAMCALEGWGQKLSGLNLLDGKTADNNATTVREPVIIDGQPNTIVLTVRPRRVQCEVNGRMIIDWTGNSQQLSLDRRFWDKDKLGGTLFLGSWDTSYAISKCYVEVLPLSEALAR